ncbi:hypothetical protein HGP17_10510 [Rhizobium sp. P38BS-XIX]|uniref:hypothetical protein n=1 Tax=Rhizobium sp. P38BS-XIX TaxID=2726740 RepID=UPI001456AD6C|nr:hypothetical protein [Rhizobium sp. P38BS-XIX]NLR97263.1 hypothetical protein [Rhizobium sp. P38BS-XIX]
MNRIETLPTRMLAVAGVVLCCVAGATALLSPSAALTGWLAGFAFASALPLGALCLAMMMRIIPGAWHDELGSVTKASILLLPLVLAASLPVLIGQNWIYEWARRGSLEGVKAVYLSPAFFDLRTVIILAGACLLGWRIIQADRSIPPAAVGLIVFVVAHGLLAVDWLMSLDAQFHSSGFGLYILSGQMLAALAMLILLRLASGVPARTGLLGALLITAILLWAYLAFMQYFIIWSGNLTQGVVWFQERGTGPWAVIEMLIAGFNLLPLFLLFFPPIRCSRTWVLTLSIVILAGRSLEYAWLTLPTLSGNIALGVVAYLVSLLGLAFLSLAVLWRAPTLLAKLQSCRPMEARQ